MLWTIFVMLVILWLLGLVSSYTLGGYISHLAGSRASGAGFQPRDWKKRHGLTMRVRERYAACLQIRGCISEFLRCL
jgi:hypothetical protein